MEYISDICEIGKKAGKLLKEINRGEEIKVSDAPAIKQLISIVQKSMDIERMEEDGGYSSAVDGMDYGRGSSSANRGQHYVRGHYSRDGMRGDRRGDYSSHRDSMGRYSRDDGRSEMMEHIEAALDAAGEKDREAIKRFMRQLENA